MCLLFPKCSGVILEPLFLWIRKYGRRKDYAIDSCNRFEVVIELEERSGWSGGRRGAARSCWQVDELCAVRGAETSSSCTHTGDPPPQVRPELRSAPPAQASHIPTPVSQRIESKSSKFSSSALPFPYRWLDLKMALHGLTLRKAKADLFDCCFVTVKPTLSDWTRFSSFSIFWRIFFFWAPRCFSLKRNRRVISFGLIS